ncbi:MAG TPA: glycosyltransferase family 4 protein [Chitinophagaceae bacterium]
MKKILVITDKPINNGPRFIREIEALKHEYKIIAFAKTPPPFDFIEYVPNNVPLLYERTIHKLYRMATGGKPWTRSISSINRKIEKLFRKYNPDIVITHDPEFLPYIFQHKSFYNCKVIYNAHEYYPLEFEKRKNWLKTHGKYFSNLYKTYLQELDLLVNVCDSIALKCKKEFGKDSIVIPNASTYYPDIAPILHDEKGKIIKMIHHGAAIRERKIEYMIESAQKLGNTFQLDLMLIPGNKKYIKELIALVNSIENVNIIPPVKFYDIVPFLNKYDIGLFNLPPTNFNYLNALPNKLFEFIQARLCIVVSNSPEMKKIVENNSIGLVSAGFSAEELNKCLGKINMRQINNFKMNTDKVAEMLSAEKYYSVYLNAVKSL